MTFHIVVCDDPLCKKVAVGDTDIAKALELLSQDTLSNLMTLKMLSFYPSACTVSVFGAADSGWAILTILDAQRSHWDSRAYPDCDTIAMIDGTSQPMLRQALETGPVSRAVYKVHDSWTRQRLAESNGVHPVASYSSFTNTEPSQTEPFHAAGRVTISDSYTEEAGEYFAVNGYREDELREHFGRGARWFGYPAGDRLQSVCLVYPNYADVWEVGGVYTVPAARRRGLGATVVTAALQYLQGRKKTPRYQFEESNVASRALAVSLGLKEFLTVTHYATAN